MLYKIYYQGCISYRPFRTATDDDLHEAIFANTSDYIDHLSDSGLTALGFMEDADDDEKMNKLYEIVSGLFYKLFETDKYIDCGDFCVMEREEMPNYRPNGGGYCSNLIDFEEVKKEMQGGGK